MEHPERSNPFTEFTPIVESNPIVYDIVKGDITAPRELEELKDFRTKREGDFRGVTVVGMRHQIQRDHLLQNKHKGHTVIFVPEPANKHDANAIAVYTTMPVYGAESTSYTWIHAGYVSATQTCNILDKSKIYEGKILSKNRDFWECEITHERVF